MYCEHKSNTLGNEAIARGIQEAGCGVATAYPNSLGDSASSSQL